MFFEKLSLFCVPVWFVFRMPQSVIRIWIRAVLFIKMVDLLLKFGDLDLVLKDVAHMTSLETAADSKVFVAGDISGKPRKAKWSGLVCRLPSVALFC